MIVEGLASYAKLTSPWLEAWNAANAMSVSATRIAVGQFQLAALTGRFMNQRLAAYASFDGRIEPLARRLDKLTEQYADDYAVQVRAIYSSWADVLREDRPLTEAITMPVERDDERGDERFDGAKRDTRREERQEQRREIAAH